MTAVRRKEIFTLPENCKCPMDAWGGEPLPICDNFIPDEDEGWCVNCDHLEICHLAESKEVEYLRRENAKLEADLARIIKPDINNLIPEIITCLMSLKIPESIALKLSALPQDLQTIYFNKIRLIDILQSQVNDYENKMTELKKLLVSF